MKLIHDAIRYPVTTAVGVILLLLFGFIGLFRLPVQLTPNVEEPEITISTVWPGASPQEIEREIIEEQEEQLKSLEGMKKMESSSSDSFGTITLTFQVGTSLDSALLKVSNRLEQVPSYPDDVEKPVIRSVDVNANAIAWFILAAREKDGFAGDISTLYDFCDDFIKPEFERVPGVAASNIYGGREREMQVIVDPARLAARRVTLNQLGAALERENRDYSGGDFDEGKRRYIVRTVGEYQSPEDIDNIVIAVRNGVPVYLRDVAHSQLGYRKPDAKVFQRGRQVLAMNAIKEPGQNVLEIMRQLQEVVARVNRELLAPRGLELVQVYDETVYIDSAIDLVVSDIYIGGLLAVLFLLAFLRSATPTFVITLCIPISIIGCFILMDIFGRSLNVVSLAGLAFASGLVVDNSIVVLENIYRHRQMGKPRLTAAHDGTKEVWGAMLASSLTTVAVFVPVVFVQEEAGQLFRDIAIAVTFLSVLSLAVSFTVIPSLAAKILHVAEHAPERRGYHNLWGVATWGHRFSLWLRDTVYWICLSRRRALAVALSLTVASLGLSYLMMPKTEYLPMGNSNFVFGIMLPPPGLNLDEVSSLHEAFDRNLQPLWELKDGTPEAEAAPGGGVENYFFVSLTNFAFMGARANDPQRVKELIPEIQKAGAEIPGAIVVAQQYSIFQRGSSEGRNIDIELTGPQLERLIELGGEVFGKVWTVLPGAQARPIPSLDLDNPEVQVKTHRRRAAELGLSNRELGFTVNALVDGAKASDYLHEGKEIDLKVMAEQSFAHRTHLLEQMPIATPDGRLVTLGSVAEVSVVNGPQTINHSERQRTIAIQVTPDEKMPLELAMEKVQGEILEPMRQEGRLGGLYEVRLTGTADKLAQTGRSLRFNFILASIITYLLMAAVYQSFLYPFVIMFSVPLGAVGGFLGLWVVNRFTYQPLDVVTMLGFIILIGTVTNNAILVVHQSLEHMREDNMAPREAIREATGNRLRPILMTVGTAVFGMLPLVVAPGAGSELYRGLGAVLIGGLIVSTVFTLVVIPAIFSLALDARAVLVERLRGYLHPAERPTGDDD